MLRIDKLSMAYGGITALREVSLNVSEGAITAIVGPNGAGKTTLLNTISGLLRPLSGTVRLSGDDITGRAAHLIARSGMVHVPEGRRILGPMTVIENLEVGRMASGDRGTADSDLNRVFALFPILAERRLQIAGSLSGGQQQMLAIGRALMARPRMLLLDEPSLGLSPLMTGEVFKGLSELNGQGLTILIVEQNARRAFAASTYAYVLEKGRIVHQGPSEQLADDPVIVEHYLGQA